MTRARTVTRPKMIRYFIFDEFLIVLNIFKKIKAQKCEENGCTKKEKNDRKEEREDSVSGRQSKSDQSFYILCIEGTSQAVKWGKFKRVRQVVSDEQTGFQQEEGTF